MIRELKSLIAACFRGSRGPAAPFGLPSYLPPISQPRFTPPHTHHQAWFELLSLLQVHELNGIKIVTYCSPLYFANSEIFREKVIAKVSNALTKVCVQPIPNALSCIATRR